MTIRIGSVPYLNAKPLVDWFHTPECDCDVEIVYAVPSELAQLLRQKRIDVANVSIFEGFQNPSLEVIPGMSISAFGAVKSVRLFSKVPIDSIRTVALDTSSLTSSALTKILLSESFHLNPQYFHAAPNIEEMLTSYDAGLIIGDLRLFDLPEGVVVYDLGLGWRELTALPFVYAAWQPRQDSVSDEMIRVLTKAKKWGVDHLDLLSLKWAHSLHLSLERCSDYLMNVMNYDLTPLQIEGMDTFKSKCIDHGLISHKP